MLDEHNYPGLAKFAGIAILGSLIGSAVWALVSLWYLVNWEVPSLLTALAVTAVFTMWWLSIVGAYHKGAQDCEDEVR